MSSVAEEGVGCDHRMKKEPGNLNLERTSITEVRASLSILFTPNSVQSRH